MNMNNKEKMIISIEWIGIILLSAVFLWGYNQKNYNLLLVVVLCVWGENIVFSFLDLKNRILFLFFNLAQFVFLMVRPTLDMISGNQWWGKYPWESAEDFAILALFLSLVCLFIGSFWASKMGRKRIQNNQNNRKESFWSKYNLYIQIVSAAGYCFTWICNMIAGFEKIMFMRGRVYVEYYAEFSSKLPYVLIVFSSMMVYFLCIFLATKPDKKYAFFALSMFIISAVPSLIIGIRNPIVLNCIFAFLYYFIRDTIGDEKKWIGRFEKAVVMILMPITVIFMGAYKYLRSAETLNRSLGQLVFDFFYSQGVSFDVLYIGYGAIPYLPKRQFRNYTFGGIIDYIFHGTIAQKLWGAETIPDGNCLYNAFQRNSFAHNMSYIAKGKEAYLNGEGFGSSYILETFTDFGYIGLIIFTILLGAILVYGLAWMKKNTLTFTIGLTALTTIFFVPRAEATGWIQFLVYIQFWLPVFAAVMGAIYLKWIIERIKRWKNEKI